MPSFQAEYWSEIGFHNGELASVKRIWRCYRTLAMGSTILLMATCGREYYNVPALNFSLSTFVVAFNNNNQAFHLSILHDIYFVVACVKLGTSPSSDL